LASISYSERVIPPLERFALPQFCLFCIRNTSEAHSTPTANAAITNMSLDNIIRRPSAMDLSAPVPLKEQGSFDDLELSEILNKPMSALPLGPEDGAAHYSSDESHDHDGNDELTREEMIARVQKQVWLGCWQDPQLLGGCACEACGSMGLGEDRHND
jgi:hypothetical protein